MSRNLPSKKNRERDQSLKLWSLLSLKLKGQNLKKRFAPIEKRYHTIFYRHDTCVLIADTPTNAMRAENDDITGFDGL